MGETCNICGSGMDFAFTNKILNKYEAKYFHCPRCGFLRTEFPGWLGEAYRQPITRYDTGILQRNIAFSKVSSVIIFLFFRRESPFVDYGGGFGIFTRLMRDIGFDFSWYDPFCENLFARGFEYRENVRDIGIVTSFENFEHFVEPLKDIEKILGISRNILFSTQLVSYPTPPPKDWWYYALEHGQHVSFYSKRTLEYIADRFSLQYYGYRDIHLLTPRKLPPSLFRAAVLLSKTGFAGFVRLVMRSRTIPDMESIKEERTDGGER